MVVVDRSKEALDSLGPQFNGETVQGTGIDEEVLRRAGIETAEACAAVTDNDNTNIMAAQVAKLVFRVPKVVARIYDPDRELIYHQLGLDTVSTVKLGVAAIRNLIAGGGRQPGDAPEANGEDGEPSRTVGSVVESRNGRPRLKGERMSVVVVGGGKVGYYLAKTLLAHGHEVTVVELLPELCERIARDMGITVINGDGTDPNVLADAGLDQADVIAAVAGHDEENLVVCQVAKRNFKVHRAVARINNPRNERIFRLLGVDSAVSGTAVLAHMIEQEIDAEELKTLMTFKRGELELVEVVLSPASPAVGRPLRELALPDDSVMVSVIRGSSVVFPRGDTVLEPGDSVLAVTRSGNEDALRDVLVGPGGLLR